MEVYIVFHPPLLHLSSRRRFRNSPCSSPIYPLSADTKQHLTPITECSSGQLLYHRPFRKSEHSFSLVLPVRIHTPLPVPLAVFLLGGLY